MNAQNSTLFTSPQAEGIKRRYIEEIFPNAKRSQGGGYYNIDCPGCNESEAYISKSLAGIKCNRENNCGAFTPLVDCLPGLKSEILDLDRPDPNDPKGLAKRHIAARGLKLEGKDEWFSQGNYKNPDTGRSYDTVKFVFPNGEKNLIWQRLIGVNKGDKSRTFGLYQGKLYFLPNVKLGEVKEVWITEGIFKSWALDDFGLAAGTALSSSNKYLTFEEFGQARPKLIFAGDYDPINEKKGTRAGVVWAKVAQERAQEMGFPTALAFPPEGIDWDDLAKEGKLNQEAIDEALWRGRLEESKNAEAYAKLLFERSKRKTLVFNYKNQLFGCTKKEVDEEASYMIETLGNFGLEFLYVEIDQITEDAGYSVRIHYIHGKGSKVVCLTAGAISATGKLRETILNKAPGAFFHGQDNWLKTMLLQNFQTQADIVRVLSKTGYDPQTEAYVFPSFAFGSDGQAYLPNKLEYTDLGDRNFVKKVADPTLKKLPFIVPPNETEFLWFDDFYAAFGNKGLVTLAYFTASLFAEQIRKRLEAFPFLLLLGEPGTGKSTLLRFIWKLLCRPGFEGTPLSETSSKIGLHRTMEHFCNLPTVLLEGEEGEDDKGRKVTPFNFEHTKTWYNHAGIIRTVGIKSAGNETYTSYFESALVIAQNGEVEASTAVLERFNRLLFSKDPNQFNREKAQNAKRIAGLGPEIGGYLGFVLKNQVKAKRLFFEAFPEQTAWLHPEKPDPQNKLAPLKNDRIVFNHTILLAAGNMVVKLLGLDRQVFTSYANFVRDLAYDREDTLRSDSATVSDFFEQVRKLAHDDKYWKPNPKHPEEQAFTLNHSIKPDVLAISMTEIESAFRSAGWAFEKDRLYGELKKAKEFKFEHSNHPVKSRFSGTVKCWVFQIPKNVVEEGYLVTKPQKTPSSPYGKESTA